MNFVLGNVLRSGIIVILIMLISTIIAGINIFLGGCRLVAWGYSNTYSKIDLGGNDRIVVTTVQ